MLQQQRNLIVRQLEHIRRQMLLMRALTEDAELLQPGTDARSFPSECSLPLMTS